MASKLWMAINPSACIRTEGLALCDQRAERWSAARAFRAVGIPVHNPIYPRSNSIPPADKKERPDNPYAKSPDDPRFPFILTTYRLTEHHTAGGMSRGLSHLAELQPEFFAEISPELAAQAGIENGGWVTIVTPRGLVSAKALVTPRMLPLQINGQQLHQVGLPYHWGWKGISTGDVTNDLLAISEDPNVRIMESKAWCATSCPGRCRPAEQFRTEGRS